MTDAAATPGPARARFARLADALAVAAAASLPWSTSATSILLMLWIAALVPSLDIPALLRERTIAAAALPLALFGLAAIGMAWADAPVSGRLGGLEAYLKVLSIPFFMIQFRSSARANAAFAAFLCSCIVLLAASVLSAIAPDNLWGLANSRGVVVKDYIAQSGEFTLCAFALFYLALQFWRRARPATSLGCVLLGTAFLADMAFIVSSRTALLTLPVLLLALAVTQSGARAAMGILAAGAVVCAALVLSGTNARDRLLSIGEEVAAYRSVDAHTSAGERLEYWKKAVVFVREAPLFGHGTGSTGALYRRAAEGQTGMSALAPDNPHNQVLAVTIELGGAGALVLLAMWLSHLALFRGEGLAAWIGFSVVIQNIVGSVFNAHLFDFTPGWLYALGVGIAGGAILRARAAGTA